MSSLLEQAIIDAAALKEAAIKNAETAILNKYSADIKEVVENLFEQEEIEVRRRGLGRDNGAAESTVSLEDSTLPPALEAEGPNNGFRNCILSLEELKDMAEVLSACRKKT